MAEHLYIGIDLGGTYVRAALVEAGHVLRRAAACTDVSGGPVAILRQFQRLISEICSGEEPARLERFRNYCGPIRVARSGFLWEKTTKGDVASVYTNCETAVAGIGVAAPGPLDSETGTILHIPTLPNWEGFALKRALTSEFGLPVVVENDGIAAAYGEWQYGAGKGLQNLVYVTVSTGIGGGVVVDGRLMHGRRGMGAHVGHFRMALDGPRCACGATGCFEALAAGTALGKRARDAAQQNPDGLLARLSNTEPVDARHVVTGARTGDPACLRLLQEEAEFLGAGFTGLIHLYSPERIIMGGGVSNAFDLLEHDIHTVIRRDAMPPFKSVPVVRAGLGHDSGLIGAAALAAAGEASHGLHRIG